MTGQMVLNAKKESGKESGEPFYMEGFINGRKFRMMINTGSPVTTFAAVEIERTMKRDNLHVRRMVENEKYFNFH